MNFTSCNDFLIQEPLVLTLSTTVVAARWYSTLQGDMRLDMVCTGKDTQSVRNAVAGAPAHMCKRIFGLVMPAEDIFDVQEVNGLYIVTLG